MHQIYCLPISRKHSNEEMMRKKERLYLLFLLNIFCHIILFALVLIFLKIRLAQLHYYGEFATQNYQLAYQWAVKAASEGNPYAAQLLAVLFYNGLGIKQDKTKGLKLIELVCDDFAIEEACQLHKQMKANLPVKY